MSAADTRFSSGFGSIDLRRYPTRPRESLQAWCAADSLLLETVAERCGTDPTDLLVVNDDHGALCLPLAAKGLWTDSALSALAVAENGRRNDCPVPAIHWSTAPPPAAQIVVMRVPKQLAFFKFQLARLAAILPPGALLLVGGMDKHLSRNTAALMERYLGPTERHPGQRKARVFSATVSCTSQTEQIPDLWQSYYCQPLGAELRGLPNVFSRDRLDGGSALLLEMLPRVGKAPSVIDLACGNGVLGLAALSTGLCRKVLFSDESAMAVASARDNRERLVPDAEADFHHGDGLRDYPGEDPVNYAGEKADLVLCNPPFHLQHTVDDFAGRRLLAQAARHLREDGRLCLVANSHLRYRPTLLRSFCQVDTLDSDRRFTVWLASGPKA